MNFLMNDLIQLINKYEGYIHDPEGNAPEIMDLFFVRDKMGKNFRESRFC